MIYDQKMKRFWNECPLLFFSTEEALEVSGTLSFALAQPAGALITQPRSAVASAVLQTIMGNILSLGNEGSTDTHPAAAAGQELCHPPHYWAWHRAGTGFCWEQIPRKELQCTDKEWYKCGRILAV